MLSEKGNPSVDNLARLQSCVDCPPEPNNMILSRVLCLWFPFTLAVAAFPAEAERAGFTVNRADAQAYSEPAPALTYNQQTPFMAGRAHFNRRWVTFGLPTGDWGLGPTFIADRCSGCHIGGGRGAPPAAPDQQLTSMLVRISRPGMDHHGGPLPLANYGDQLQNNALQGQNLDLAYSDKPVPAEARIYIDWSEREVVLDDGERVALHAPQLRIEQLAFGPLGADTLTSLRIASPVFGLGLLEAVPEHAMRQIAARQHELGYNGRLNVVWDEIHKRPAIGRFGWKSNVGSIKQQIVLAALGDMGVTSSLFPKQNCPPVQDICQHEVPGNSPELIDPDWNDLEFWTLGLAAPAARNQHDPEVQRGAELFERAQCSICHVSTLRTAERFERLPQLANQEFHAYTDLLLHDMGEELADGRPDFEAGPRDWRTPPLWGLGLSQNVSGSTALLHDGRARNVTEAIVWHGGEAATARNAFKAMTWQDRAALLRFLDSI